jgi:hypothetical protein
MRKLLSNSAPGALAVRTTVALLALGVVIASCGRGSEASLDDCSNGRDDDGDGLIDCREPACRIHAFCEEPDSGRHDAGPRDAGPRPDGSLCARPIDVVLSLDVSSSMIDELAIVRDGATALFDRIRALDPDARIGLVVFVDDALAVADCSAFTDGAALAAEIESWRRRAPENRSPVSGTFNQDCPENSLDALHLTTTACPWREGSERFVVHITDDTFVEHPAVLSGPYGGGVLVAHTYEETSSALAGIGARVIAIALSGVGEDCGAGRRSPDVGQGFHGPYRGQPSLPERTGGRALDLNALRRGTLDLAGEIASIAELAC